MFDGPAKPSAKRPHIVGLGGTTRIGSSSEAALRYTMGQIAEMGASTELIAGPLIDLPMYDPADPHRSPSARRLVQSLRRADGVVIATPSYHGALSGVIKNALDYVDHALRGWPTPFAATLNGQSRPFENGLPANEEVAGQLRTVAQQVYEFACAQQILRERLEPTRAMAAVGT